MFHREGQWGREMVRDEKDGRGKGQIERKRERMRMIGGVCVKKQKG